MAKDNGWIGVDLDKTIARSDDGDDYDPEAVGEPIMPMVERVKKMLADGKKVKIFTARAQDAKPEHIKAIEDWSEKHLGQKLPITNVKDRHMRKLYDDRAVGVVPNEGHVIGPDPDSPTERMKSDLRKIAK